MSSRTEHLQSFDVIPNNIKAIIFSDPFLSALSNINVVYPISGGVAHFVYCIESDNTKYYLKIRGNHFAAIPSIECNPEDIDNEHQALTLFGRVAPEHFPKVLSFNNQAHYLVLTDVIGDGEKLDVALTGDRVPQDFYVLYGRTLACVLHKTAEIRSPIRPGGDSEYYTTILGHRFGYRNHPILNEAIKHLSAQDYRQLILADPAPKNMGIRNDGKLLTFFDLETAHQGNPEFDYAYGAAHTMLHSLPDPVVSLQHIMQYAEGYGEMSFDPQLVYQLTLGIVLYRLRSIVPYPIRIEKEQRKALESHIDQMLFQITGNEQWADVIDQLHDI